MLDTGPREVRSAPVFGRRRKSRYCSVPRIRALAWFRQAALGTSLAPGSHKDAVPIEIPAAAVACATSRSSMTHPEGSSRLNATVPPRP